MKLKQKNELKTKIIYIMGGGKKLFSYGKRYLFYGWHKWLYKSIDITTCIVHPIIITPQYLECGKNVYIGYHARLEGISRYNDTHFTPLIKIGEGVSIQQNLHLTCACSIIIGKHTAIAANVTITDIHHPYSDIDTPIEKQDIEVGFVRIGEDSKIYNNVVILPNVTIGKHVTIGANSVVTQDIPDYCVAVGIPAKVIKIYDFENNKWMKT